MSRRNNEPLVAVVTFRLTAAEYVALLEALPVRPMVDLAPFVRRLVMAVLEMEKLQVIQGGHDDGKA